MGEGLLSSMRSSIRLRITGPDGRTRESFSEQESVILGSGVGAGIRIQDPHVSDLHLMLKVGRNGVVKVIDLGSEHGTSIGGRPIRDPVALVPGDVINIGTSRVEVLFGDVPKRPANVAAVHDPNRVSKSAQWAAWNEAVLPVEAKAAVKQPVASNLSAGAVETVLAGETAPSAEKVLQVAMLWGNQILGISHFALGVPVTVGPQKGNDFLAYAPSLGKKFELARIQGKSVAVQVPSDAALTVFSGKKQSGREQLQAEGRLRLGETKASLELSSAERAKVVLGNITFVLRQVAPSPSISVKRMEEHDSAFLKMMGLFLLAGLAVMVAFALSPKDPVQNLDTDQNSKQMVHLLLRPEQKAVVLPKKKVKEQGAPEGAKAQNEEGKIGKPEVKQEKAAPSKPGSPITDPRKREDQRQRISKLGILGALKGKNALSNLVGPGGVGTGINNALGGLKAGAPMGDQQGVGGVGSRGSGVGGGGTGLGIGGLGLEGAGRGAGGNGIELANRGHDTVRIVPGKTNVVGGLPRDVIAKIIRAHQSEIKYCYEVELQKTPDLAGKVAVLFVIGPDGVVGSANVNDSSLDSSTAEQCMLGHIKRWKFPEAPGGGATTVTFPWIFKPAGKDAVSG